MPYNVIILSSTVIALAFGSVFNILVRRFVALDPEDEVVGNKLYGMVLRLGAFMKSRINTVRRTSVEKVTNGIQKGEDVSEDKKGIERDANGVEKH